MPDRIAAALRVPQARLARAVRRRRRPLAALLAGLAALLALTALRTSPDPGTAGPATITPAAQQLRAGDVIVPLPLRLPGISSVLHVGDVVDVVALPADDAHGATVVAPAARVVELPTSGSALTGSSAAMVLVGVRAADALDASAAAAGAGVTVVIRDR
jgi:hypothetical protein